MAGRVAAGAGPSLECNRCLSLLLGILFFLGCLDPPMVYYRHDRRDPANDTTPGCSDTGISTHGGCGDADGLEAARSDHHQSVGRDVAC